ncbi:hypothetical protein WR25_18508 isoform F [Diploscapter pachys]|nr:hypothetical protein WR25_18508 isoform F [Diploscapter pachys]
MADKSGTNQRKGYGFSIDRGGTFTDICLFRPDGSTRVYKLLSVDPSNYKDAPTEGIRRLLEEETGQKIDKSGPIPTDTISWIRMGTTVATNALLERQGERMALVVTRGFGDLLFIGNQSRPRIFDLNIKVPEMLYEEVIEVKERVLVHDKSCAMGNIGVYKKGINDAEIIVEQEIDETELIASFQGLKKRGIDSIAVVLLHSFIYPNHELQVAQIARKAGISNISLSHQLMPMIKAVPRGFTVSADAYLTPKILDYIKGFESGFKNIDKVSLNFMQSDGGLCNVRNFCGSKAILSGPAGGVVGVAMTAYDQEKKQPIIGFDMGGTSTDVCRYAGHLEQVMETTTAGVTIQAPQLDINTVAAGGGSRLYFRNGLFTVGPESAGAHPGPVCYKKNGHLTITDANVVLGRVLPDFFPAIFGPKADEILDKDAAYRQMEDLTKQINEFIKAHPDAEQKEYKVEEVALGFVAVANEEMCRPIRALTQSRGYDTAIHALASFGGAGGQHACSIARILGINTVFIHKYSSVLSAFGIALADVVCDIQEPAHKVLTDELFPFLKDRFNHLSDKAENQLIEQGFPPERITCEHILHMRYERTDSSIIVHAQFDPQKPASLTNFIESFREIYKKEYGFNLHNRNIIVDDVRIRGVGKSVIHVSEHLEDAEEPEQPPVTTERLVFFDEGKLATNIYQLHNLKAGHTIRGPALIIDNNSTVVVEPLCKAMITKEGNIRLEVGTKKENDFSTHMDPIRLAIFSNRFMSIAEQMGKALQRTSISTNIKERLDFSCALFGPDGGLIANAPHIPVHLGGMQYAVTFQIEHIGLDKIKNGDVFLSNHPKAGGSHLPDFTVITPVFIKNSKHPVFFVANRGHHADIGGLVPGSMPPHSTKLIQEGAAFISFKLVDQGNFQEEELIRHLKAPGEVEGCSGSRNITDNISDLKAQIAANNKGIFLVCDLIEEYSLEVVQAYMQHIRTTAEDAVKAMLKEVGTKIKEETGSSRMEAVDCMDDGTDIKLKIDIDVEQENATFDFTGTGPEVFSSINAPRAITMSAIIYCLRCLVNKDIPLNSGCLEPIKIHVPHGTILSPSDDAAVVGGNVLTSQRLCDVIFKAFGAVAASQGCMNNVTFGDESMGYYETIAGGSGAGNGWNGRDAIHTHMTNTRITDPEIFESRYPVILREFRVRPGSGGKGKWKGGKDNNKDVLQNKTSGNGVIRSMQFRRALSLSLLTERR